MAVDHIRYDILTQEAMRGLVRNVLADTAANGLPGDHHFQISFETQADGVRLSQRMRTKYPEEMTIVLQHQFWDLAVSEDGFEVGLSFGGVPERIVVPFEAITAFYDPSVQFGVRFEEITLDRAPEEAEEDVASEPPKLKAKTTERRQGRPPAALKEPRPAPSIAAVPAPANSAAAPTDGPDTPIAGGGEVVRLDRFRKK